MGLKHRNDCEYHPCTFCYTSLLVLNTELSGLHDSLLSSLWPILGPTVILRAFLFYYYLHSWELYVQHTGGKI